MLTLQINTKGGWRNVLDFHADKRDDVIAGLKSLANILGDTAKWSVLHEDGRREWLLGIHLGPFPGWQDVTAEQPAALTDVLVSVFSSGDEEPMTFMAYRKRPGSDEFYVSGSTGDDRVKGVYAWGPIMEPARLSDFNVAAV